MSFMDPRLWSGKVFVGGWIDGGAGVLPVREPATGSQLAEIGVASEEDVDRAAQQAAIAQRDWARLNPEDRAAVLRRAGDLWEKHAEEIQSWLVREGGSIPPKAALETHIAANECYEAAALPSHPHGEVLTSNENRWSFARRLPAGVVSVIAPFNFPLVLSIRSVAPALALGNAVLLKPDLRTAVGGGVALVRVFEEAGLPAGLLQLLPGGVNIGETVVAHPLVRVVSFTGSTAAGRRVGELGARHLKRVHLELGGKSALIILPGADVAAAASAGAFGSFMHQGQICMATGRHLVHESLHDEYVSALADKATHLPIGDPTQPGIALGPIIDANQVNRIDSIVSDTIAQGARLATGGTFDALFYRPTVLAELRADMSAWNDEIFGPVAPVLPFATVDDAIDIARATDYGLSLGILGDVGTAMKIADAIPSGKVHINEQTVSDEANAPFGGVGSSGNGSRFGGAAANIDAFTETQWLTMRPEIAPYPF
jgi:benzaldehyde dehydrogenase (NAD)